MFIRPLRSVNRLILATLRLFPSSHYALLAILFLVGLELIFALQRWVVIVALAVVSVVAFGVLLVRNEEGGAFRFTQIILPFLGAAGIVGFAFLLPTTILLHIYIVTAAFIFFLLLKHAIRQAYPIWNWAFSLLVFLLNIAFVLGLRFHLNYHLISILTAIFVIALLMSLQALRRVVPTLTDVLLPAFGLAFILTEVAWVLQFFPSHYLAQASILAVLYYVIFNLISLSYTARLRTRDILEYLGVGVLALFIIIFMARWT